MVEAVEWQLPIFGEVVLPHLPLLQLWGGGGWGSTALSLMGDGAYAVVCEFWTLPCSLPYLLYYDLDV